MTLFEHLSIAISLIFSFSVVRVLEGFRYASSGRQRYVPHLVWLVVFLLTVAVAWWAFWSFEHADWNLLSFLLVLALPCSFYLVATALVPDTPSAIADWRAHFFAVRRRVFVSAAACQVVFSLCTLLLLGLPLLAPRRAWALVTITLFAAGALSANPRFHDILPVVFLLSYAAGAVLFLFRPGTAGGP